MAPPNEQPVLPAEAAYTDLEQLFISEQPKNLWPENQNSNLGAIRKVLLDVLQGGLVTLSELSQERFVVTSLALGYLGRHELEYGLPVAPTGKTEADRRSMVLGRKRKGPFTRSRRDEIIEAQVAVSSGGAPTELTPSGVEILPAGITLFAEGGPVNTLYRVYEDVDNFSFVVRIKNTITPDLVALTRELRAITPGWLNFTITSVANILDYPLLVGDDQPIGWWPMGVDFNDASGYGRNLVAAGGGAAWTSVASLLTIPGAGTAWQVDGTRRYEHTTFNQFLGPVWTTEIWVDVPALTAGQSIMPLSTSSWAVDRGFVLFIHNTGGLKAYQAVADTAFTHYATEPIITAGIHHFVQRRDEDSISNFIDGVKIGTVPVPEDAGRPPAGGIRVGIGPQVHKVDELAIYSSALSDAEILEHYNTGKNIP